MPKNEKKYSSPRARGPRRLSVRGVLRQTPDLDKIAGTLKALALAQAEKDAQDTARRETPDGR